MLHDIKLHYLDYIVFMAMTCISLSAGSFYAYKERNNLSSSRYHRGDGKLKVLPVAVSLMVTFESSIAYLGYPAEVYIHGLIFWMINIGFFLGFSSMAWVSVPIFHNLKLTSVYEYLEIRYKSAMVRRLASVLGTLGMVLYIGIVLYGVSTAIAAVTNIPAWVITLTMVSMAVIYTSLGGIKAVVVTDVVQTCVMIITLFAVIIFGTIKSGGISNVISINKATGRLQMIDVDPNPLTRHTCWSLVIGGFFRYIALAFTQSAVQRTNSVGTKEDARKVVYIAVCLMTCLQVLLQIEGLVAYAYFSSEGCDPLSAGLIDNPNQIIPFTVLHMFHTTPGVSGLFFAALSSASLSTVSSMLGSISAVISEDIVKPYWTITDAQLTKVAKVVVVVFAGISLLMGLFIGLLKGPMAQIGGSILGAVDSFLAGMFILSIFMKFMTRKGVITGGVSGLLIALLLSSGYNFSPGRKHTPYHPAGPIDQCWNVSFTNESGHAFNESMRYDLRLNSNMTDNHKSYYPSYQNDIRGIDYLFSISYLYFPLIVLAVTILVGAIVSKLTSPIDSPEPHLLLSLPKCRMCKKKRLLENGKDHNDTKGESIVEMQPLNTNGC